MIIKAIGMITIVLSSALLGFGFAECMASRERELENLVSAVERMIGELSYTHLAMKEIIFRVCPFVMGESRELFEDMCTSIQKGDSVAFAWCNALDGVAQMMSLKKEDADALKKCAYLLEAYELEEQKNCLEALKDKLKSLCADAEKAKRKNSSIVKMLGIYGGVLICIIVF